MRMRRCVQSVANPALEYFSTLSHKPYDKTVRKYVTEYKMCFDFLYKVCLKLFSCQEELREVLS
jgi:hypothetical protein